MSWFFFFFGENSLSNFHDKWVLLLGPSLNRFTCRPGATLSLMHDVLIRRWCPCWLFLVTTPDLSWIEPIFLVFFPSKPKSHDAFLSYDTDEWADSPDSVLYENKGNAATFERWDAVDKYCLVAAVGNLEHGLSGSSGCDRRRLFHR